MIYLLIESNKLVSILNKVEDSRFAKENGAAIVEFAFSALLFFSLLFAVMEFGYMYWVNLTMQHAVRDAVRYASVTGPSNFPSPSILNPSTQAEQRCNALVKAIKDNSLRIYDSVSPVVNFKTVTAGGSVVNIGSGCGSANEIILVNLDCTLPLITPLMRPFFLNGKYSFSVSATMKNEAFK